MTFWIQHGYGKGQKIERLASEGAIDGVVLSPADETISDLKALVQEISGPQLECLLDPQTYVYNIADAAGRLHEPNGLKFQGLEWSAEPTTISQIARVVERTNSKLGIDSVIAPAPLQRTFVDRWAPLGLQLARGVARRVGNNRTIASVIVHETALDRWDDIDDWLNSVTKVPFRGFYIVIARSMGSDYPSAWDVERLSGLLRLIYRLRVLNQYDVFLGYSDLEGLAAVALGASMATGWFHSQRRFVESKWRRSVGGAPAIPRFMSDRLLVPLRVDEVRDLIRNGEDRWVSSSKTDRDDLSSSYTISDSRQQYLTAMARLAKKSSVGDVGERLNTLDQMLATAHRELRRLGASQLARGYTYANIVDAVRRGIGSMRSAEQFE